MRKGAKISQAKHLRKAMSKPEVWLWSRLKSQHKDGPVFRRQVTIGRFILDFYCVKARLAIEVDGARHNEDESLLYDLARDTWLLEQGIETLRLQASELLAHPDDAALGVIHRATERMAELGSPLPSASLPPSP